MFGFVPASQPSLTGEGTYREAAGDMFAENVETAQQLMADAGYPGGEGFPVVHIVTQNSDEQKLMAQIIGEMWKGNLGIEYDITTYESSTYWDELANGNFSVGRNGFTCDYLDPSREPARVGHRLQLLRKRLGRSGVRRHVLRRQHHSGPRRASERADRDRKVHLRPDACMPVYTMVDELSGQAQPEGVVKNPIGHIFFEYAHFE